MTYTEPDFSLISGFKKIVLTPDMISVINGDSQKKCLHQIFLYTVHQARHPKNGKASKGWEITFLIKDIGLSKQLSFSI